MLELIATNPMIRLASLAILFALVAAAAALSLTTAAKRRQAKDELRILARTGMRQNLSESLTARRDSRWDKLVDRLERAGINLTDTKGDAVKDKLLAAGYESPSAGRIYSLIRLISVFVLPAIIMFFLYSEQMSLLEIYFYCSAAALLGLFAPSMVLDRKIEARRQEVINSFPSCLDLMLVCVEAGLGMEAALDRVGREMIQAHPVVARLLIATTLQLRAGASREAALRKMADSAGVKEIASFATLLIQSDRLGTSIASALRIYAAEMREHRRLRAEEKAHRLPVLMSIPLVACLLPVMIGVLMLPGIVRLVREIFPAMMGTGG